jgi:hypothetical protein
MPALYRSTVTIGGNKFDAVSTSVRFGTLKDRVGMPEMGSLTTKIKVWVDFHDDTNLPFGTLKQLFTLANLVTRDKIIDIKIEFWKDENKQEALCSYLFKGWISEFETSNPMADSSPQSDSSTTSPYSTINHLLYMELEPALDQQNFTNIAISN